MYLFFQDLKLAWLSHWLKGQHLSTYDSEMMEILSNAEEESYADNLF